MLVFGGESREVQNWDAWLRGKRSLEAIRPGQTNLEGLISRLLERPGALRSVYLFTDGWETEGRVERVLSALPPSSLRIFPLLPTAPPKVANVVVKRIHAPSAGESGEGIQLRVAVDNLNAEEVSGRMILKRNGQRAKIVPVRIKPGSQLLSFDAGLRESGLSSFEVQFIPQKTGSLTQPPLSRAFQWLRTSRSAGHERMVLSGTVC